MKILHTSDWHLGKYLENVSRIDEQREFIDELCSIVEKENIDIVLIAGDIYDTFNPSAVAEDIFYDAVDNLSDRGRRAVVVIAGNHDYPERLCAASPLAHKNAIFLLGYPKSQVAEYKASRNGVELVDTGSGWLEIKVPGYSYNAVILTMPYPSETRLEAVLSDFPDESLLQKAYSEKIAEIFSERSKKFKNNTVNLVVGHMFLKGGKESDSERQIQVGGALTVDPKALPSNAHYAALGHLHRPQNIRTASCPAYYSGSPIAYSFSEADHNKAVYIIDAEPSIPAKIEPYYLKCGKPLRRWVAENGIQEAIKWCEEKKDENALVDLEVVTDRVLTLDEQRILRNLHPGIINIRPRIKTQDIEILNAESREGRRIEELFMEHYKYRMGTEISEELMSTFIEILNEEEGEQESDET